MRSASWTTLTSYLVALVVNGHPHIDPGLLRAHAMKLQLLASTMPNIRVVLQDPRRVAAALRAIADMVHVSADWKPQHLPTGPPAKSVDSVGDPVDP